MMIPQLLEKGWQALGQGHVFRFWDELKDEEKKTLINQLESVDLCLLKRLIEQLHVELPIKGKIEPCPLVKLKHGDEAYREIKKLGENVIREGRVAAFTVAGGQATRLGYNYPKGMFPVTPVRGKTLFQIFAEKIKAANTKYRIEIPWYIMTSPENNEATVKFFREHNFFGLSGVKFFCQGMFPSIDFDGKVIMATKYSLAMNPDGHGGSFRAMANNGVLDEMKAKGIDTISYFQVDNPLVNCVDPVFVGYYEREKSEMGSLAIQKKDPAEKVGVFVKLDGRVGVIEYSNLSESMANLRDEEGQLIYRGANIAVHLISRPFIEKVTANYVLPFNKAKKKIEFIDDLGEVKKIEEVNGVKFEQFVFDAIPYARNPIVLEVERGECFSPVKNAEGSDSLKTCQEDQLRLFAKWLKRVGEEIPVDETGLPLMRIEISPLFAENLEDFKEKWQKLRKKVSIRDGFYLESDN